jgi:hypothetical protein
MGNVHDNIAPSDLEEANSSFSERTDEGDLMDESLEMDSLDEGEENEDELMMDDDDDDSSYYPHR